MPQAKQRHLLRDTRRVTTACPACWVMGKNLVEVSEENIFCTGPNLLYRPNGLNEPMEGPLESPFQNPVLVPGWPANWMPEIWTQLLSVGEGEQTTWSAHDTRTWMTRELNARDLNAAVGLAGHIAHIAPRLHCHRRTEPEHRKPRDVTLRGT